MQVELTRREIAQLLAALRNWQTDALNEDLVDTFSGHFEDHAPLEDKEIDALCERLNLPDGEAGFADGQTLKGAAY